MRQRAILPIAAVTILALGACGAGASPAASEGGVEGFVGINGSSTVEPVSLAVAEAFAATNAGFDYSVEGAGTGDGFKDFFCLGETEINDASRAIDPDEEAPLCEENAVEYVELLIGYDGITVFTSADTALECLNLHDLYALFGPESSDFETWDDAQALAADLGSTTDFPTGDLAITAPGDESGTYTSFIDLALGDIIAEREQGEALGTHYIPSPNDNVIVENVSGTENSLGFAGFAFYENNTDVIKAIEIDAGDGCNAPTTESIADGSYPLSRPLFIYPSVTKAAENPALVAFVDYYLSDEGIANVDGKGYVSLPDDELTATRQAWEDAKP